MGEQSLRLRVSPEGEAEKDLTSMRVGLFLAFSPFHGANKHLGISAIPPPIEKVGTQD
jgi:hypothetical protein